MSQAAGRAIPRWSIPFTEVPVAQALAVPTSMAGLRATRASATVLFVPPLSANPAGTRIYPKNIPAGTQVTLLVPVPNPHVAADPGPLLADASVLAEVTG